MKVIFKNEVYRIIEVSDEENYSLENLKGDCFKPELNDDIDPEKLRQEELDFEKKVEEVGVFGYQLQKIVMGGHETIDCIYGFVGPYDDNNNPQCHYYDENQRHYIVDEMKATIQKLQFAQFNYNSDRELLTQEDRNQIYELLSKGLRYDNRNLMYRRLFDGYDNLIPTLGILGRVMKDRTGWSYCAGQSYTEEMRTVRKIILTMR